MIPKATPTASDRTSRRLTWAFLALGLLALVLLIAQVGARTLLERTAGLGWSFVAACALHFANLVIGAAELRLCAGPAGRAVRLRTWVRAETAGHAINTATPFGQLGELTKYALLAEQLPGETVATCLVLGNLVRGFVVCAVFAIGQPLATLALGLTHPASTALHVTSGVFALMAAALALFAWRGVGEGPFRLARRLRVSEAAIARARAFVTEVETLSRRHADRRRLAVLAALVVLDVATLVAETHVVVVALGAGGGLAVSLLAQGSSQLVVWVTAFVPMQAGTAEGGAWMLFRALGLPPGAGVLVELVKKARRVVFLAIAVALLGGRAFRQALAAGATARAPELETQATRE